MKQWTCPRFLCGDLDWGSAMVLMVKTRPSLRQELFTRVLVLLLSIQFLFVTVGMFAASWLVRSKKQQQLLNSANKAVELYGILARYGDVRYARFVVLSNSEQSGLLGFRVFDSQGEEIQAANPSQTVRAPDDLVRAATVVRQLMPQDGRYHTAILAETVAGSDHFFAYALRTTDGADYILTLTMLNPPSLPWLLVIACAIVGILISSLLAFVLARMRTAATVRAIESYAENVRSIPHLEATDFPVPYEELAPIHTALTGMVGELRERANFVAIAQTTQMLAHDVRKPFSILRMGLTMLGNAKDPASAARVLSRLIPEVDRAVSNVDGLIADVMEIGASSIHLIREPMTPEALIEAGIADLCRVHPQSYVRLSYDFQHTLAVSVHVQKVARVFSNILGNAVQAMKSEKDVWFKTRDVDGFVEFCIGNSGSLIPPENLPRLFDAFFTTGKKTGTGLGLAIAQKVITEHGGQIWCQSHMSAEYPEGLVEFFFTLPMTVDRPPCGSPIILPQHTRDIAARLHTANPEPPASEHAISYKVVDLTEASEITSQNSHWTTQKSLSSTKPEVAVVEDNPFILEAWVETLSEETLVHAAASPEVLSHMLANDADLLQRLACVVTDFHFDNSRLNGIDVGRMVKQGRPNLPTLISSDGWVSAEEMTGAIDRVIPKEALSYSRLKEYL